MFIKQFAPFQESSVYVFRDPDTGREFSCRSMAELLKEIVSYRAQNELEPIEALPSVVVNYLCGLGINAGKCVDVELKRSWTQYVKGGVALLKNLAFKKYVDVSEADRRAAQCVKCVHNVFPDKGPFMAWADDIAIQQVGERRSKHHNELGNCAVCSCPLRSKVFIGGNVAKFSDEEVEKMRAVSCWQLKLSGQE